MWIYFQKYLKVDHQGSKALTNGFFLLSLDIFQLDESAGESEPANGHVDSSKSDEETVTGAVVQDNAKTPDCEFQSNFDGFQ